MNQSWAGTLIGLTAVAMSVSTLYWIRKKIIQDDKKIDGNSVDSGGRKAHDDILQTTTDSENNSKGREKSATVQSSTFNQLKSQKGITVLKNGHLSDTKENGLEETPWQVKETIEIVQQNDVSIMNSATLHIATTDTGKVLRTASTGVGLELSPIENEKLEKERKLLEKEKLEKELKQKQIEQEYLETEKLKIEKEKERLENERIENERLEQKTFRE